MPVNNLKALVNTSPDPYEPGDLFTNTFDLLFWDTPDAVAGGEIKAWNGSAFVSKPVKYWTGAAWVTKPIKRWNGSTWL